MNAAAELLGLTDLELDASTFTSGGTFEPRAADVPAGADGPPAQPAKKGAKKRSRPKKVPPEVVGAGVVVLGDRFCGSYSGEFSTRAIFIPGVDSACFRNIPCAFAFLDESGASAETIQKLKEATCESYGQELATAVRAPDRTKLANFGGDLFYEEWMGELLFWDQLTDNEGLSVTQYKEHGGRRHTALKRGKGSGARVSFDAAAYSVAYGKGPAGCQLINALDAVPLAADTEKPKHDLSIVRALRKLSTFVNTHKETTFEVKSSHGDGFYACFIGVDAAAPEDDDSVVPTKLNNHIAQQILGMPAYGPALFIFTRKYSQRI